MGLTLPQSTATDQNFLLLVDRHLLSSKMQRVAALVWILQDTLEFNKKKTEPLVPFAPLPNNEK